jgi:pyruvate/2-oxoacid:ferredoxin oxidoreductase alpha subunit
MKNSRNQIQSWRLWRSALIIWITMVILAGSAGALPAADGAAREAVEALRAAGTRVSHLTIYSLWPVPRRVLRRAVTPRVRRVIVPELNIGLYSEVLRGFVGDAAIESVLCFDGRLIPPDLIVRQVRSPSTDRTAD